MDLPSPQELPIMDTLQQEPLRMLSADMQLKLATMFLEDSDGIATVYLLSTK